MSAISFTIPGLIKKVLNKLPVSTADLARASVCTEQRLGVLDDIGSHIGRSGSYLKVVTLSGSGTWSKPADMLGSTVWVTGCGAGGRGGVFGKSATVRGASAGACAIMVPVTIGNSVSYSVASSQPLTAPANAVAPSTSFGPLLLMGGRAASKNAEAGNFPHPGGGNFANEFRNLVADNVPFESLIQSPALGVVWTGGHGGFLSDAAGAEVYPPFQNPQFNGQSRVQYNVSADSLLGASRQGGTRYGSGGVARMKQNQENDAAAASGPGFLRIYYPTAS